MDVEVKCEMCFTEMDYNGGRIDPKKVEIHYYSCPNDCMSAKITGGMLILSDKNGGPI